MNNSGSGFQRFSIWAVNSIPLFAVFVCWIALLSAGEFIDGVKGVNCQQRLDLVTSPQTIWNRAGCVVNGIREVIPSRGGGGSNTAP
jgi:hypothetical protein